MKKLFILVFLFVVVISCNNLQKKEIAQYTIEQFMNNASISGSSFSPDESKILFTSNESGIYNVYEINLDGSNKNQLTNRDESTFIVSCFPNDERVLITSDKGGNEIYHLYLRESDSTIRDITPYENARASFAGWSRDFKSFYIQSNKRDPRFMDLYEMDIETFEPTLVFENNEGYYIGPVSADKNFIALSQPVSRSYTKMYLFDKSKNEITELKNNEETTYSPVEFSNDSKTLYYLTDYNNEFTYVEKINLDNLQSEMVYKTDWDVMYVSHSFNEKYRVIGINQDAKTDIKIFEASTGNEIKFPGLEGKDISSVNISKSENLMSFYVSSSKTPRDLFVYNFENSKYTQLSNSLNAEINPDFLVESEVVRYKSFDGLEIPAILYKPLQASPKNKVPALVWVHGGPGGQSRVGYSAAIQYFVNHGYAIIAVNNRGSSGYGKTFYA